MLPYKSMSGAGYVPRPSAIPIKTEGVGISLRSPNAEHQGSEINVYSENPPETAVTER